MRTVRGQRLLSATLLGIIAIAGCTGGNATGSPVAGPTASPAATAGPTASAPPTAPPIILPATPTPTPEPSPTLEPSPTQAATPPINPLDLTGVWKGTWQNTTPNKAGGTFTVTWTQDRELLSGSITITGTPCLTGGVVTGSIKGTAITFGVVQGAVEVNYAGVVTLDGLTMSGGYATQCGKAEGDWQAARP